MICVAESQQQWEYIPGQRRGAHAWKVSRQYYLVISFLPLPSLLVGGAICALLYRTLRNWTHWASSAPLRSAILQVSVIQKRPKCEPTQNQPTFHSLISMWSSALDFNKTVINCELGQWGFNSLKGVSNPSDTSLKIKGASRHLEASYWGFMELWT